MQKMKPHATGAKLSFSQAHQDSGPAPAPFTGRVIWGGLSELSEPQFFFFFNLKTSIIPTSQSCHENEFKGENI